MSLWGVDSGGLGTINLLCLTTGSKRGGCEKNDFRNFFAIFLEPEPPSVVQHFG